jgi:hypothetical protein
MKCLITASSPHCIPQMSALNNPRASPLNAVHLLLVPLYGETIPERGQIGCLVQLTSIRRLSELTGSSF